MALDCLAWLMRLRGRVVAEGCIIGRGFAFPLLAAYLQLTGCCDLFQTEVG